jgi:endonuclease YncB( thermonuclease family)
MDTDGGKAARRFVQALIDPAVTVTLVTTKPDKYDRYLVDVYIETKTGEIIFLNNALLESGHAVRSDGSRSADGPV